MKSIVIIGLMVGAVTLSGCVSKVLILQSPMVSMTKNNAGEIAEFSEGQAIDEKWCVSDKPEKENDDGSKHYGMIDQVVMKAHHATKADFFVNTRFYQQGNCVLMSANVAHAGAVGAKSEGASHSHPNKKK